MIANIETLYVGTKFRSRLEARWAVFFDTLKIKWHYEVEGFRLSLRDGQEPILYLPDFYIPSQEKFPKSLWVEVKSPADDSPATYVKALRLARNRSERVTILRDIPWCCEFREGYDCKACREPASLPTQNGLENFGFPVFFDVGEDEDYAFCQCPFCGRFGFEFNGRSARIGCKCPQHIQCSNGDKTYNTASFDLMNGFGAARSCRFDGGIS